MGCFMTRAAHSQPGAVNPPGETEDHHLEPDAIIQLTDWDAENQTRLSQLHWTQLHISVLILTFSDSGQSVNFTKTLSFHLISFTALYPCYIRTARHWDPLPPQTNFASVQMIINDSRESQLRVTYSKTLSVLEFTITVHFFISSWTTST